MAMVRKCWREARHTADMSLLSSTPPGALSYSTLLGQRSHQGGRQCTRLPCFRAFSPKRPQVLSASFTLFSPSVWDCNTRVAGESPRSMPFYTPSETLFFPRIVQYKIDKHCLVKLKIAIQTLTSRIPGCTLSHLMDCINTECRYPANDATFETLRLSN